MEERSVSIRRLGAKGQKSFGLEEAVRVLKADAERIGELPAMAAD